MQAMNHRRAPIECFALLRRFHRHKFAGGAVERTRKSISSRNFSSGDDGKAALTPAEAGRLAHERASSVSRSKSTSIDTVLARAGVVSEHNAPQSPPLHLATTYARPPDGLYDDGDSVYGRIDNKTRLLLESTVSQLECHGAGDDIMESVTCAFSSGMAAVSAVLMAHSTPVKVLVHRDAYHGVPTVLEDVFSRHGVEYLLVDYTELTQVEESLLEIDDSSDVVLWLETPSNPLCEVIDVAAVCRLVRRFPSPLNITTVVDSTMAPPCLMQPLMLGADVVVHSGTKYLGGHSDVLLGLVVTSPWTERGQYLGPLLRQVQISVGSVASAFDSWLTLRGLRTLHIRVRRLCTTALTVARHLSEHPLVAAVHYPGLAHHPQHVTAREQMKGGYGGVLSFELENEVTAMAVAGALCTITRATSLGGTETLVEHRRSIEPQTRKTSPPGLLRISVGIEDANDLVSDLDQALSIAHEVTRPVETK